MSKIYLLYLLNVLIIPLLIYPQKLPSDEFIKVDIIKKTSMFKPSSNLNKTYFFGVKKNKNSMFKNSTTKKSEKLLFKNLKSQKADVILHIGTYRKYALLLWKNFLNTSNKLSAIVVIENNKKIVFNQKQNNSLKRESESEQIQRNDYLYLTITISLLLIGGGFAYNKHLKGTNTILRQKSKLNELNDTKDQLLTIICHDLRSSVNALKDSNAKLTTSLENKNYAELNQLLHKNSTIANGAYNLLDNILHWALLQTKQLYFHKDSVHLFSVVQQIEYNYRPLFRDKALVFENSVPENCFIYVDLDSLKIVLRNLFDNAIKFSNKNAKISIYVRKSDPRYCQIIVEDTGTGIDQNTIAELLKDSELLCKKTNSDIIGAGLGLQLCKMMIQKNGGKLAIESELTKGTKMILSFPKINQNG